MNFVTVNVFLLSLILSELTELIDGGSLLEPKTENFRVRSVEITIKSISHKVGRRRSSLNSPNPVLSTSVARHQWKIDEKAALKGLAKTTSEDVGEKGALVATTYRRKREIERGKKVR